MEQALADEALVTARIKVGDCPRSMTYSLTRYMIKAEGNGVFSAYTGTHGDLTVNIGVKREVNPICYAFCGFWYS